MYSALEFLDRSTQAAVLEVTTSRMTMTMNNINAQRFSRVNKHFFMSYPCG